ncbi:MAG: InlB B-repeat-containing protein, partial [Acholeplasmataceae bacterium]
DGSETPFDFLTYQVVEDIIINGRWDEEFTVSFDSNGGSAVAAQTILDGQTAIEPTNPVKSGFEFKGWFTDDVTFLNEFNFSNVITEDVSLFAKWDGKLMIYEVYGGGGNSGATYTHDYIVLYNGTSNTINLTGYSIQYTSATGTSWTNRLNLNGSIESGNYYLIQLASGGSNGIALPTPNITGTINMSATNGKVALVNSTTALTGSNPSNDPSVVDFVGFGTADGFEGSGPAVAPSNSRSIRRKALLDTNDNSADFEFINSPDLSYLSSE